MKLIVGIGNPGKRYEGTRHNVGFEIIDLLAREAGACVAKEKFHSLATEAVIGGDRTLLILPQTYVNETGRAVRKAVDWYDLEAADVMVVCDDFNLPLGRMRIRAGGSSGGHRGLESVAQMLGTQQFARLRVGIGGVPVQNETGRGEMTAADYVLSRFMPQEQEEISEVCHNAVKAIEVWIRDGIEAAMNEFNRPDQNEQAKGGPDS